MKDAVTEGVKSPITTTLAFAASILNYFVMIGPNLPKTKSEWASAAFSAVMTALGVVLPDASKTKP